MPLSRSTTWTGPAKTEYSASEVVAELRSARRLLAAAVALLCLLGLVMVYSASWGQTEGWGGLRYFIRQGIWLMLGASAAALVSHLDYRRFVRARWGILLFTLGILALVLIAGTRVNGAKRWFRFGGVGVQASEFAKVGLVLFLAAFTAGRRDVMKRFWGGFVPGVLVVGTGFVLIAAEPDLGMALLWATVGGLMLFCAGARLWHCILAGMAASPLVALLVIHRMPYIVARLQAFFDPSSDPSGKGYQATQSVYALARGGIFPAGLGRSVQKLYFLPEPHTDFIFAIIGEELGFFGALLVVAAFLFIVYQGLRISFWARDAMGHLMAVGATAFIGLQAGINIGVVTAALPTKGMALPFLSYGGSNLITSLILTGILVGVARRTEKDFRELPPTASFTLLPTVAWPVPEDMDTEE